MRTSITLGAGLLLLAGALVLRNGDGDSVHVSQDTAPSSESQQLTNTARPRPENSRTVEPRVHSRTASVEMLGAIEAETDPDRRSEALDRAISSVSIAELPGLLDSLAWSESSGAAELREPLVRRWAETDGPAAAAWAARLETSPASDEALAQIALGWAATDPGAALDWARTLPEGERRESIVLGLGYETARTDAVEALKVAASLEPTRERDDLIEHAISQWATADFTSAVRWTGESVSDPNLRHRLLAAVAVAAAAQDGAAAATLAATLTPGAEQDRVAVAIVQRWVQNEPNLTAAWVAQFPDTPARQTAAQNLVAFWATQNGEAAADWLRSLPEGALRTDGIAAYATVQLSADEFTAPE